MSDSLAEGTFVVFQLTHAPDGELRQTFAGRFRHRAGSLSVIADPFGLLRDLDGRLDERRWRRIYGFARSAYTQLVFEGTGDLRQ